MHAHSFIFHFAEDHPLQVGASAYLIIVEFRRSPRASIRKIACMDLDMHPSALQWLVATICIFVTHGYL